MDKLRLMIADSDERFTEYMQRYFKSIPEIELAAVDHDGRDALSHIRSNPPDVVMFDLVLAGLDGISLLRIINEMPDPPATICCTRFYSDVTLEAIRNYGASYLVFKPFDPSTLVPMVQSCTEIHRNMHHLRRMSRMLAEQSAGSPARSAFIRNFIISLGVPSNLMGCSYLTEAVQLAQADMSLMHNLSKGLYLEVARIMSTTSPRIERCIRNAISAAYQKGDLRLRMNSCPSNKEFINYILRNLPD